MIYSIHQKINLNNHAHINKYSVNTNRTNFCYLTKDVFQPTFTGKYHAVNNLNYAERFAIRHLGLKKFDVDNLDVANWVNGCLQHNKNISKGASMALDEVIYTDFDKLNLNLPKTALAMMQTSAQRKIFAPLTYNLTHKLYINKKYIKNIDKYIKNSKTELLNNNLLKYEQHTLKLNNNYTISNNKKYEKMLNRNINHMSTEEKIELDAFLHTLKDYAQFKESIVDESIKKILNDQNNKSKLKNVKIPQINRLNSFDKFKLLNYIERKLGIKHDIKINSKYRIINHEIGHMLHAQNDFNTFKNASPNLVTLFKQNLFTVRRVSEYAVTNIHEFVAETYAKIADGFKMPQDVMYLYYKFGGLKIN